MAEAKSEPIEEKPVLELEEKVARRDTRRAELKAKLDDPDGREWHRKARAKWRTAEELATVLGVETIEMYDPEPLPDFRASAPAHVTRPDVYGRFLVDRDTLVVHDVYASSEECGIDGIRNGTYVHFLSELLETIEEETPCAACIGA